MRVGIETLLHRVEQMLVLPARDAALRSAKLRSLIAAGGDTIVGPFDGEEVSR